MMPRPGHHGVRCSQFSPLTGSCRPCLDECILVTEGKKPGLEVKSCHTEDTGWVQ